MRALITGITGQDGSYMAELLLGKGYEVFGIVRRSSVKKFDRIETIVDDIELVEGDLTDQSSLDTVVHAVQPDEESAGIDRRCDRSRSNSHAGGGSQAPAAG